MTPFKHLRPFLPAFAAFMLLAGSLALAPQAQAGDWSWGFGKSVKGSGNVRTESRNVSGFSKISLAVPANAELVQGTTEGVSIESDDNILPLIETVVENGTLKIRFSDKNMSVSTKTLKVTINAKTVEGLSVAGSGDLRAARLQSANLKTNIAGSGDVVITLLDADALVVSIAGSGNFTAGGKARSVETKIAGSGELKIGRLEAGSVKISVAGSGDATVWAREALTISVAGSGDVKYYGDAKVTQSVAGSGSVKRLGTAPGA